MTREGRARGRLGSLLQALLCLAVIGALLFPLAILNPYGSGGFSVCSKCWMMRFTRERQIPFTEFTYHTTHTYRHTKLSQLLAERNLVEEHEHQWVFGHGRGDTISTIWSGSGAGKALRETGESALVIKFIEALSDYSDVVTARKWVGLLRVYQQGFEHDPEWLLIRHAIPHEGFSTRGDFEAWREKHAAALETALRGVR